ncbi:hypothetical protein B0O99DRAFT_745988 [Bisporella sp. PMI_857]|nr:hypothetical protein B0O99DRAFT_745988 [Bisporella sp. PMI_857]
MHILILGAGPCGLAAAIALSEISTVANPIQITVIELRPSISTLGGAVNLTPLALRYLDSLGAGHLVRSRGCKVDRIDVVSLRTGGSLGSLWDGLDLLRVQRKDLVQSLSETVRDKHARNVEVLYGKKTMAITENIDAQCIGKVQLEFSDGSKMDGDVLLGCDGLHSVARRLFVDPSRKEVFTGRAVVMGYAESAESNIILAAGDPALTGTTMIQGTKGQLLLSYFEPAKSQVYLANVMVVSEPSGDREIQDGWKAIGDDKEGVRSDILGRWQDGGLHGIREIVEKCDEWTFYPVYALPPSGKWTRGKVLLMGDAAHAMPPQGESTGIAIEDGILIARIFQRRDARSIQQLFSDYEATRRDIIHTHYKSADWRWKKATSGTTPMWNILLEWFTIIFLAFAKWKGFDAFKEDVSALKLPE